MLIVIEGLDGSGKSTQVGRLREYLGSFSTRLDYIHFPRYDAPVYGGLIGKYLKGGFGDIDSLDPQIVALLYADDRRDAAPRMRKTLSEGGVVLLDRYVYSNIAYQCAKLDDPEKRNELRKWILDTEYGYFALPKPDVNIFLDVPIAFVESKLSSERKGTDRGYLDGGRDIHEKSMLFQKRVREEYLHLCETDPSFIRLDCSTPSGRMMPASEIFRSIVDSLGPAPSLRKTDPDT